MDEVQNSIMQEALAIKDERARVRGEVWRTFDEVDSIHHMKSKVARVDAARQIMTDNGPHLDDSLGMSEEAEDEIRQAAIDDCHDIINYAAFTIRHLRGETAGETDAE